MGSRPSEGQTALDRGLPTQRREPYSAVEMKGFSLCGPVLSTANAPPDMESTPYLAETWSSLICGVRSSGAGFYAVFQMFNSTFYLRQAGRAVGSRPGEEQSGNGNRSKGAK
jgi:hypothetical protein